MPMSSARRMPLLAGLLAVLQPASASDYWNSLLPMAPSYQEGTCQSWCSAPRNREGNLYSVLEKCTLLACAKCPACKVQQRMGAKAQEMARPIFNIGSQMEEEVRKLSAHVQAAKAPPARPAMAAVPAPAQVIIPPAIQNVAVPTIVPTQQVVPQAAAPVNINGQVVAPAVAAPAFAAQPVAMPAAGPAQGPRAKGLGLWPQAKVRAKAPSNGPGPGSWAWARGGPGMPQNGPRPNLGTTATTGTVS